MKNKPLVKNFDQRKNEVNMLVLHYTGLPSLKQSMRWLTNPEKKVSAHYLIGEKGEVFQLVPEEHRAWHAGISYWAGETDINSCSIGVEVQNPGHAYGYQPFPDLQIEAVSALCKKIIKRYKIPANRVLGHSDVAPGRKPDPGEMFPWERLFNQGIGVWPSDYKATPATNEEELRAMFNTFGYNPECPLKDIITAFQRHWQPNKVDGKADEETWGLLKTLL